MLLMICCNNKMMAVSVDNSSLQADLQPSVLASSEGRQQFVVVLCLSYEPGELSQWLFYDDSTTSLILVMH